MSHANAALQATLCRGLPDLRGYPGQGESAEVIRAEKFAACEALEQTDEIRARMKALRLQTRAGWWIQFRHVKAEAMLAMVAGVWE